MGRHAWGLCLLLATPAFASSVLLVPSDERSRPVAEELIETFAAEGVTVKLAGPSSPAVKCLANKEKRNACLGELEGKAKVDGVVVMVAKLKGPKVTIGFELLSGGEPLRSTTAKGVKGKLRATARPDVAALMWALKKASDTPEAPPEKPAEAPVMTVTTRPLDAPKPPPADAPKPEPAPVLAPAKAPIDDELALREAPPPPASKGKPAAWVVTGVAVVAAGAAATLGGMGAAGTSRLATTTDGVAGLSYADAEALRDASNTQLSAALGLGIGAGLAGITAGLLWAL